MGGKLYVNQRVTRVVLRAHTRTHTVSAVLLNPGVLPSRGSPSVFERVSANSLLITAVRQRPRFCFVSSLKRVQELFLALLSLSHDSFGQQRGIGAAVHLLLPFSEEEQTFHLKMRRLTTSCHWVLRATSVRYFARPSAVQGTLSNNIVEGGFVTNDVYIDLSPILGGQYARGIFAKRDMGFGREIMSLPAFSMYIGEEPLRAQVLILVKNIFAKLATNHPDKPYIQARILTMHAAGLSYFTRERDVFEFAESVPLDGCPFGTATGYLNSGEYSTFDLQKLPMMIEHNRWEVEYHGRRGICLFPEAQYFNHQCEPNVEISLRYDSTKGNFILSARTCKPVKQGEELYINYMPGNTMPLSRFGAAMRKRWGFECMCIHCKSRAIGAIIAIFIFVLIPFAYAMTRYLRNRRGNKERSI